MTACGWHATAPYTATHIIVFGNHQEDIWDVKACETCTGEITRMLQNGGRKILDPHRNTDIHVDMAEIRKL